LGCGCPPLDQIDFRSGEAGLELENEQQALSVEFSEVLITLLPQEVGVLGVQDDESAVYADL